MGLMLAGVKAGKRRFTRQNQTVKKWQSGVSLSYQKKKNQEYKGGNENFY